MSSTSFLYHVSDEKRRWVLLVYSISVVCLSSGVIFGWPALRKVLLLDAVNPMSESELAAVFTIGAWSVQGGQFVFGLARDRFGTRRVAGVSMLSVIVGSLCVALMKPSVYVLSVSMLLIGLGSSTQLCLLPVADLFPKNKSGIVMNTMSGAFQTSGLVFLVITSATNDLRVGFGTFALVVFLFLLVGLIILPDGIDFAQVKPLPSNQDDVHVAVEINKNQEYDHEQPSSQPLNQHTNGINSYSPPPINDTTHKNTPKVTVTAREQLRSREYLLLLLWFSILLPPLQFYVGSIGLQLERHGDDTGFYTNLYSIIYASLIVVAPFLGFLIDMVGLGIGQALGTICVAVSFFLLGMERAVGALTVVHMIFYALGRMLVFGLFFTNVGKRFGFDHYGTLAGTGLFVSSLASLLQLPLMRWVEAGYMVEVNVGCGLSVLGFLPYCAWLFRQEKRQSSK